MKRIKSFSTSSTLTKKYISEFTLPYESFVAENVNTENIDVPVDGVTVTVSITTTGALRIEVVGFEPFTHEGVTYNHPVAKIDACVTTFNKEIYVFIGDSALYTEYDLT